MEGGNGNDTYVLENGNDNVVEEANAGADTVRSSIAFTLGANVENLVLLGSAAINGTGDDFANVLTGNDGNDILNGAAGADLLFGGADDFVFRSVADTTAAVGGRDTILDFSHGQGDDIALSAIDANTRKGGNQGPFSFIDDGAFSDKAGELRFIHSKGDTFLKGDVNGDGKADFSIGFDATIDFVKGDFIL